MKSDLPVACSLTPAELQERRSVILERVKKNVESVTELPDGYVYQFPRDPDWIAELAQLVTLERQCCPFLQFCIVVQPDNGPIALQIVGPTGTKEFLRSLFD